jgi:UDP-N-acetylglucosamine acyltransferase
LIHSLTHIDPAAKIAENVTIEPFATIKGDVEIGSGSWIGPNVVIDDGARIGKNVKVFAGAVISSIPQDLKYKGEYTTAEIGDNSIIREYVTVNRGTSHSQRTIVGKNVLLMAYTHVAHDCIILDHAILANAVNLAGHVTVDEFAIIGGMSAIHQFCRIGAHSILAGGSLVGKDIPPFVKAARYPISFAGVNTVGLMRRNYSADSIHKIKEMYHLLYLSGYNTSQALTEIEGQFEATQERDMILQFIRGSQMGIMPGYRDARENGDE